MSNLHLHSSSSALLEQAHRKTSLLSGVFWPAFLTCALEPDCRHAGDVSPGVAMQMFGPEIRVIR